MDFLRRLMGGGKEAAASGLVITREGRVQSLVAPVTARQAFGVAQAAVEAYGGDARLTMIVSGEDISVEGLARLWEFLFIFPSNRMQGIITVAVCDDDVEEGKRLCLRERVTPFVQAGGMLDKMVREGTVTPGFIEEQWRKEVERQPGLPVPFRDSPEAVRELREKGADFIAGDTHMTLAAKVNESGEAVWQTIVWNVEYEVGMGDG